MANPQHEPTMEEILASIRKIISEDTPPASPDARPNGEADVLDLTQEVRDVAPSSAEPEPANSDCSEPAAPATDGNDLFSEKTRASVEGTMFGLPAAGPTAGESRAPGESIEEAFERAVREAFEPSLEKWLAENSAAVIEQMKPVIREWLDEHFPAMLQNAVRSELARATRPRQRRQ